MVGGGSWGLSCGDGGGGGGGGGGGHKCSIRGQRRGCCLEREGGVVGACGAVWGAIPGASGGGGTNRGLLADFGGFCGTKRGGGLLAFPTSDRDPWLSLRGAALKVPRHRPAATGPLSNTDGGGGGVHRKGRGLRGGLRGG